MLEKLHRTVPLTTAPFAAAFACRFLSRLGLPGSACTSGQATHCRTFEFPRRTSGSFLAAVNGIAEHLRYRLGTANEMDLESVRLFFCTSFRVNTPDVLL